MAIVCFLCALVQGVSSSWCILVSIHYSAQPLKMQLLNMVKLMCHSVIIEDSYSHRREVQIFSYVLHMMSKSDGMQFIIYVQ